jgi:hypothetical protein
MIYDPINENQEPDSSAVFDMANGEKVRIDYNNVFIYRSSSKASNTVVELGYAPNTETLVLDISFDDFDKAYQANRKAWRQYWDSKSNSSY